MESCTRAGGSKEGLFFEMGFSKCYANFSFWSCAALSSAVADSCNLFNYYVLLMDKVE